MLGVHHVTRCKPFVLQAGCSAQFHLLEFTSTGKLTDRIIELSWDPAFSVVFIRLLQHITHAVVSPKPIETPRPIWPPEFLPCSGRVGSRRRTRYRMCLLVNPPRTTEMAMFAPRVFHLASWELGLCRLPRR